MVNATYKRQLSQSYMILEGETETNSSYELEILSYNRITGFLPMETEVSDGVLRFWYDITGKQTFSDYLGRRQMDLQLLSKFFQALEDACRTANNYLLEEDGILLDLDYLYMDFEQKNIEFAYFPGLKEDIRGLFRKIMEQILQKLDHDDKQAVAAAYEVYQHSLQGERSLGEMLRYEEAVKPDENQAGWAAETIVPKEGERTDFWQQELHMQEREAPRKQISGMLAKTAGILKRRPGFGRKEREDFLVRPEDVQSEPEEPIHPTELLHVEHNAQGVLVYQGTGNQRDLRIEKPLFLIGKNEKEVDGRIDSACISRVHARIELEQGEYYITDMNSTNGTYLNGERLEYRQRACLKPGDQVVFGRQDYRFQ